MTITFLALEVVTVDAPIIGDPSSYHLVVASPSQISSSVPENNLLQTCTPSLVNPTSINENHVFLGSTIPFTSLASSSKIWSIQGRVIAKTNIHEYGNQWGSGKVFGFYLVNASHDEIHISTFNELTLSFYEQIHLGVVYIVSNDTGKASNPIFNYLKSHNEIFLVLLNHQTMLKWIPLNTFFFFNFKTI